jgi:OmpA-OmpF porin, OOP family
MMTSKSILQKWKGRATVLSLLAFLSASCVAEVRNPALERGRNAYERVRRDPAVVGRAAVALEKTRSTLEEAERVWAEEKDANEVEHLVYLTEKRAEIALATARRRIAADEIQQLRPQR